MFLAIDAGNSNIVLGIYDENQWVEVWRIETDRGKRVDDYVSRLLSLFEQAEISPKRLTQVMIASVVPNVTVELVAALKKLTGEEPVILTPQTDTGISLKTNNPAEIGPDLIAGVVGGYNLFQEDCIVVDFGTATTLMAVKKPGELVGGAICAGLKITADSLVSKAAMLSDIPLAPPPNILAKNTIEAMQCGLVVGHICMVEGLVARMKKKLDEAKIVATGGLAETLASLTNCFDSVEPLLTLDGMRIISERQM